MGLAQVLSHVYGLWAMDTVNLLQVLTGMAQLLAVGREVKIGEAARTLTRGPGSHFFWNRSRIGTDLAHLDPTGQVPQWNIVSDDVQAAKGTALVR